MMDGILFLMFAIFSSVALIDSRSAPIKQGVKQSAEKEVLHHEGKRSVHVVAPRNVAFTVYLAKDQTFGEEQTVNYTGIITNLGGGYNWITGHFTSPVSGLYQFSLTAMAWGRQTVHLDVVQDEIVKARVYCTNGNWDMSSVSIYLEMTTGQSVWVKRTPNEERNQAITLHGAQYKIHNVFSGALIKPY